MTKASGFIYWVPAILAQKAGGMLSPRDLRQAGLIEQFENAANVTQIGLQKGPDGGAGFIVADSNRISHPTIGYKPNAQTWQPIEIVDDERPICMVGYETENRPSPASLERPKLLDSVEVQLSGHTWKVPRIQRYDSKLDAVLPALPSKPRYRNGRYEPAAIADAYADLWEMGNAFALQVMEQAVEFEKDPRDRNQFAFEFDYDEVRQAAGAALAINYAAGPIELIELGAMEGENPVQVMFHVCDMPSYIAAKKNDTRAGG